MTPRKLISLLLQILLLFAIYSCTSTATSDGGDECNRNRDCDGNDECCDGECVDISDDEDNCGGCGDVCFEGQHCENGMCVLGSDGDNYSACGNNQIDPGEHCDGTELNNSTCISLGFGPGALSCKAACSSFELIACGPPTTCGDGEINGVERCDGAELGGATCVSLGRNGGSLRCLHNCADYDLSSCGPVIACGNNRIEPGETCDGNALAGQSCVSLGFGPGTLSCKSDCSDFDRSACMPSSDCGNNQLDGNEVCDGAQLDGGTCEQLGFSGGTLQCQANCGDYDTSLCGPKIECGNNRLEQGEVCDGQALGGETCISLELGPGTLTCEDDCKSFNTSGCAITTTCGDNEINGGDVCDGSDLNGQTCEDFGHWGGTLRCRPDCKSFDEAGCIHECEPACDAVECGPDPLCGIDCSGCDDQYICTELGICERICDLDAIIRDTRLDIDLPVINITGRVTLNGQNIPDNTRQYYENYNRGSIGFINKKTNDTIWIQLGATGAATYTNTLFAGLYDIQFSANNDDYQDVLPYQKIFLEKDVELTSDRTKNFDLRTVRLYGEVELNGSDMPDNTQQYYENYNRGSLGFIRNDTGDYWWIQLGATGKATYNADVFVGDYRVEFSANNDDYQNVLPYQKIVLEQAVEITQNRTKTYNLQTVRISGDITVNGSAMRVNTQQYYENYNRGSIGFARHDTGDSFWQGVGATGRASYSIDVFVGDYTINWSSNNDDYQNVLPYQKILLNADESYTANVLRNYNLETVVFSGEVTVNGSAMSDNSQQYYENYNRGSLGFVRDDTGDTMWGQMGATGRARYNINVFTGNYTILFSSNNDDYQNVLPYQKIQLDQGVALQRDTQRNFNLQTVVLDGKVTVNGGRMADNTQQYYENYNRGSLQFRDPQTGDSTYYQMGATGEGRFTGNLFVGRYDILFSSNNDDYQNVLPYQKTQLLLGENISGSRYTKTFDLTVIQLNGEVTVNGSRMGNNTQQYYENYNRGSLGLTDRWTGNTIWIQMGATGAATYSHGIFAGTYNVFWSSNNDDYQNVLPYQKIQIRTGCFDAGDCDSDPEDITGTWLFICDNSWWGTWTFALDQSGRQLTGSYANSSGQAGGIEQGTRSEDTIDWYMTPYCRIHGAATVQSGCMMNGWMRDIQCANTAPFTNFVGFRLE